MRYYWYCTKKMSFWFDVFLSFVPPRHAFLFGSYLVPMEHVSLSRRGLFFNDCNSLLAFACPVFWASFAHGAPWQPLEYFGEILESKNSSGQMNFGAVDPASSHFGASSCETCGMFFLPSGEACCTHLGES